jgi:hypothetical protein
MSKKVFSEKEIKLLSANQYVKSVSKNNITYTDEFKQIFISEKKKGKFARNIFEECGFDGDVLGRERIRAASRRWQEAYRDKGLSGLCDARNGSSGRLRCRELTLEEKNARLEAEINLLKAENELLKKIRFAERGMKK